jgi:hypothetical protein
MHQARVGTEPSGKIINGFIAPDRLRQPVAAVALRGSLRELAPVGGLKRDAFGVHFLQVASDLRRVDTGIEIVEVPFRQLAGAARGFGLGC